MLFGGFRGISAYDLNQEAEIDKKLFNSKISSNDCCKKESKEIKITYFYDKEPVSVVKMLSCDHGNDVLKRELCEERSAVAPLTRLVKWSSSDFLANSSEQSQLDFSITSNLQEELKPEHLSRNPNISDEPPKPPPRKRTGNKINNISNKSPIPLTRKRAECKVKSGRSTLTEVQIKAKGPPMKEDKGNNNCKMTSIRIGSDSSYSERDSANTNTRL